jgi:hypothetical protein
MPFMSITTNLSISPVYEWISRFNRQNDPTTKVRVQITLIKSINKTLSVVTKTNYFGH